MRENVGKVSHAHLLYHACVVDIAISLVRPLHVLFFIPSCWCCTITAQQLLGLRVGPCEHRICKFGWMWNIAFAFKPCFVSRYLGIGEIFGETVNRLVADHRRS